MTPRCLALVFGVALLAAGCNEITDADRGLTPTVADTPTASSTPTPGDEASPTPTVILGTGDIQVTLEWNDAVDLDLWVTDPDGETIWFLNPESASGGQLDVDNQCFGLIVGRPENIFWPPGGAPLGEYLIEVDYFDECDDSGPVEWRVTVRVRGDIQVFEGTVNPDERVEVTTIELTE